MRQYLFRVYNTYYNRVYRLELVAEREAGAGARRYKHFLADAGANAVYSHDILICFDIVFDNSYFKKFAAGKTFLLFCGNYVSNNDATCTADGTKTAKCDRCDATDTVTDAGTVKLSNPHL